MDKQGNAYTFLYASIMVIVVAAVLSFAAISLKDRQNRNVEIAKKSDILKSVNIASTAADAEAKYEKYIKSTYVIDVNAKEKSGVDAFSVDLKVELAKPAAERSLAVFECQLDNGEKKYILPVRGKGLWGPVWGYVALNEDKQTVFGANFGHKGETPGLGAEIEKPEFSDQFKGKKVVDAGKVRFSIVKGGAQPGDAYAVDAISGGTITSKGVEAMLNDCLSSYGKFLNN